MTLFLPFNEKADSVTAYDYSKSRTDAIISGANVVPGESGNALLFSGNDSVYVSNGQIDLDSNFTILYGFKAIAGDTGFGLRLNSDPTKEIYRSTPMPSDRFTHVAITRDGDIVSVYVDGVLFDSVDLSGEELTDLEVYQDKGNEFALGVVDSVRVFQKSMSVPEIMLSFAPPALRYYLDGVELKEGYDIVVSASAGVIDALKRKDPFRVEWEDYHGEVVDLQVPIFEAREITLDCWIPAAGMLDFAFKMKKITDRLSTSGTHRLKIEIDPTRPLVYEVYAPSGVEVDKKWSDSDMVGKFQLVLREPEPVKRVLRHIRSSEATKTAHIELSCDKLLSVFWGDKTVTRNVYGTNVSLSHSYEEDGEYDIIITGNIDEITSFTSNTIQIWDKL